jgi:hypothetical protein
MYAELPFDHVARVAECIHEWSSRSRP